MIGAGFAGLAAADALQRAGVDTTVLEARDRAGGRVWSVPFAGAVVERGAEFVLPGYTMLTQAVERFGLSLIRKGTLYGFREPRGGEPVTLAELAGAMDQIAAHPPPGNGTLLGALAATGLRQPLREAICARTEVSCAYHADDLAGEALTTGAAGWGEFDSFGVKGGNDRVAKALAATLPDIRLAQPARHLEWSDNGVRVDDLTADAAVIAVPATTLADLAFDPPLPEVKRSAIASVRYGQAAKLFVALGRPHPRARRCRCRTATGATPSWGPTGARYRSWPRSSAASRRSAGWAWRAEPTIGSEPSPLCARTSSSIPAPSCSRPGTTTPGREPPTPLAQPPRP